MDVGLVIPLDWMQLPGRLRVEHRKAIPAQTMMRRPVPTAETTLLPAYDQPRAEE